MQQWLMSLCCLSTLYFYDLIQTLWWSSNMWQINGDMPKQGLNLKKPLPVIRKKPCPLYKHEYTELWNCLKPSAKGIHLYGVLPVRLTSHVHTVKGLTKCHFETKGHKDFDKLRTNKKSIAELCVKSVKTVLKRDGGTRRMQSSCYAPLFHKWILTLRHYPQIQTSN
jgi:hypothetical protein